MHIYRNTNTSRNIFQSIGKSVKSAVLSLSRQIIFLIPAMIILGHFFGVSGILYSAPVADGISFVLAITLLVVEIKENER